MYVKGVKILMEKECERIRYFIESWFCMELMNYWVIIEWRLFLWELEVVLWVRMNENVFFIKDGKI